MLKSMIVAGAMVLATAAFAQGNLQKTPGSSANAPGQMMNKSTTSTSPGATEYAPGQKMKTDNKVNAKGASEYAPGHRTTVGSTKAKK